MHSHMLIFPPPSRSPPLIQMMFGKNLYRLPIHCPYLNAFSVLKMTGLFPTVYQLYRPMWAATNKIPFSAAFLITQSTYAKYASLGFTGSLSISGLLPSALGVFNPSSSARATA